MASSSQFLILPGSIHIEFAVKDAIGSATIDTNRQGQVFVQASRASQSDKRNAHAYRDIPRPASKGRPKHHDESMQPCS